MGQRPPRGRQSDRVGLREDLSHHRFEIAMQCAGCAHPLVVLVVAFLPEHEPEQRRPAQREPHILDGELTDLGRSLVDIYAELRRWAESHAATVLAHRDAYDEAREAGVPASTTVS